MILVAGGTGTLGAYLIGLLTDRGLDVRILAREPAKGSPPKESPVDAVLGDVRNADDVERAIAGTRTVVSAITGFGPARDVSPRTVDAQGNSNLIHAAKAAGVEHFVLLSVRQAAPDHPIELFRMKYRAEQELKASGLAWTIIRPTAYMETWLRLLAVPLLDTGKTRIFGGGENPINFVSARDIAHFVELATVDAGMRGMAVDVGGPEDFTMNQVVQAFEELTGARGKVSHVPLPMMRVMSVLMKPVNPALADLTSAAIVMDTRDMTFDPSETSRLYPSVSLTSLAQVIRSDHAYTRSTETR